MVWIRRIIYALKLFLAFAFLVYGSAKLIKHQFAWGDFTYDSRTDSLMKLSWFFFGRSRIYTGFIGMSEILGAIFLMIPRTSAFGSLVLFALSLNITFLDFCYDWPEVRFIALGFTILSAVFIAFDWPRIKRIFDK